MIFLKQRPEAKRSKGSWLQTDRCGDLAICDWRRTQKDRGCLDSLLVPEKIGFDLIGGPRWFRSTCRKREKSDCFGCCCMLVPTEKTGRRLPETTEEDTRGRGCGFSGHCTDQRDEGRSDPGRNCLRWRR
ncbi:hypothetical protein AAC387_Pa01g2586 [Persea americana]